MCAQFSLEVDKTPKICWRKIPWNQINGAQMQNRMHQTTIFLFQAQIFFLLVRYGSCVWVLCNLRLYHKWWNSFECDAWLFEWQLINNVKLFYFLVFYLHLTMYAWPVVANSALYAIGIKLKSFSAWVFPLSPPETRRSNKWKTNKID